MIIDYSYQTSNGSENEIMELRNEKNEMIEQGGKEITEEEIG